MKTKKTLIWFALITMAVPCSQVLTLNSQVLPGPDNTICTIMGTNCRDERNLVDSCRYRNVEGCIGNYCVVYLDIPSAARVCFTCTQVSPPQTPANCHCEGSVFIAHLSEGVCHNDQGTCYCSYDLNQSEEIAFYTCGTGVALC